MKCRELTRKCLAWTLCLVMVTGMLGVTALAVEEGDAAPAAPAEVAVERAEAPAAASVQQASAGDSAGEAAPAARTESSGGTESAAEAAPAVDTGSAVEAAPSVDTGSAVEAAPSVDTGSAVEAAPSVDTGSDAAEAAPSVDTGSAAEAGEAPDTDLSSPAMTGVETPEEVPAGTQEEPSTAADAEVEADPDTEADAEAEDPTAEEAPTQLPAAAEVDPAPMGSASLFAAAEATSSFTVDWSSVGTCGAGDDGILDWSIARNRKGYYLYCVTGPYGGSGNLEILTADGESIPLYFSTYNLPIHTTYYAVPDGATATTDSDGQYQYTEIFLPASFFPDGDFSIVSGSVTVDSGDIPSTSGSFSSQPASADDSADEGVAAIDDPEEEELDEELDFDGEAVYDGIVIDGSFADWDAVPLYDISDGKGWDTVDHVAMVWDGDWVYILLKADGDLDWQGNPTGCGNWNSVTGAGTHGNGQYAITTDLGRTMLIQPVVGNDGEPAVAGVDGAAAAVNTKSWTGAPFLWELAIPVSELPEYLETINFGFYMSEPTISGVSDLQGGAGVDPFKANVVIDGQYSDWVGYPHSLIQYDHQGIQHHEVDGEAALWSDDGWLYGHVVTQHPDHLAEQGSCFLSAISIAFNGDRSYKEWPNQGNFYPRILAIDENGTITDFYQTVNEGHSTPNGTYTYYIFDTRTDPMYQFGYTDADGVWHDPTAAELIANAFGTMKVTVTGVQDEMEFNLDLSKVAAYIEQDGDTAFKTIEAQFGRIGQQWVVTAGTPTGPLLGVALAIGAVSAPACVAGVVNHRKRKEEQDGDGQAQ